MSAADAAVSSSPGSRTVLPSLLAAALAGGVAAWWLLGTSEYPFAARAELKSLLDKRMAMVPLSAEETGRLSALEADLERRNAAAAVAALGLPIAAAFGAAAGVTGRSLVAAAGGTGLGLAAGALVGGAAGWLSAFVFQKIKVGLALDPSYAALGAHAVTWVLLGVACAVAAWPGLRRRGVGFARMAVAAAVGGVAAAALYPIVAGLAFQMNNSDVIIPSGRWNRLAWIELAAVVIAASLAKGAGAVRTEAAPEADGGGA